MSDINFTPRLAASPSGKTPKGSSRQRGARRRHEAFVQSEIRRLSATSRPAKASVARQLSDA